MFMTPLNVQAGHALLCIRNLEMSGAMDCEAWPTPETWLYMFNMTFPATGTYVIVPGRVREAMNKHNASHDGIMHDNYLESWRRVSSKAPMSCGTV